MKPIPFIVGFGGLSAAGRSAFHMAYNRLVIEEIDDSDRLQTFASLAIMMNLVSYEKGKFYTKEKKSISLAEIEQKYGSYIKENTLLRKNTKKKFAQNSFFQNLKIKITPAILQKNLIFGVFFMAGIIPCCQTPKLDIPADLPLQALCYVLNRFLLLLSL